MPHAGGMDETAIRRAAVVTLRLAICQRFPPGAERTLWLCWLARAAARRVKVKRTQMAYDLRMIFQWTIRTRKFKFSSQLEMEKAMTFKRGELIGVPCSIQLGPFPDERLVTVETDAGIISGFVKEDNLETSDGERGLVKGTVVDATDDSITVKLFGSFFTTAQGVASVKPDSLTHLAA